MNPFETLRHAFRSGGSASDQSYSMVLLEKHHHFLRKETLIAAAERAFHRSFTPGNTQYAVHQSTTTFIQAGEHTIHVTQSSKPYQGHAHEIETRAGDGHLHHHAWRDHTGFVAFDIWGQTHTREEAYRVLAALTLELLDEHVTGVYLPRDNDVFPMTARSSRMTARPQTICDT